MNKEKEILETFKEVFLNVCEGFSLNEIWEGSDDNDGQNAFEVALGKVGFFDLDENEIDTEGLKDQLLEMVFERGTK